MCCSFELMFRGVSQYFQTKFEKLGKFIGRYPKQLIVVCMLLTSGLALGMLTLNEEQSIELLYTPINSRSLKDRSTYQTTFADNSDRSFVPHAAPSESLLAEMIFTAKGGNVFSSLTLTEIRRLISTVKTAEVNISGEIKQYKDVCALMEGECQLYGEFLTTNDAFAANGAGTLTYPEWRGQRITRYLGESSVTDGVLTAAKRLKVIFYLRQETKAREEEAREWERQILAVMAGLSTERVELHYQVSQSLTWEVENNSSGDVQLFVLTFAIMISYSCFIVGGDPVSARTWAASAGIMAALFGIVSSLGLISLCRVKFVNIVGVVPYLIIGIGVDDMFLLMSSWADTYTDKESSLVHRMGQTFRSAGIGITITSLTDLLAFVVGYTSAFYSVKNFCVYMGVAIIFCYIYQCLFFGSCLALHGHRVDQNRHCITCAVTKSKQQLKLEDHSCCTVFCCGGSKPTKRGQDERFIEKLPRRILPKFLLNVVGQSFIVLLYLGYIGVSVWGIMNFKQGLELKRLSSPSSYYFQYTEVNEEYFEQSFSIAFVFDKDINYARPETKEDIKNLFEDIKSNKNILNDTEACWLTSFQASPIYDDSSEGSFLTALKLFLRSARIFKNDVVFDIAGNSIIASRCHFFTVSTIDSNVRADTMTDVRRIADDSPLSVYPFQPLFVYFEQFVTILPSTLQTVGIALVVMTVVTFIFLPHPVLVLIVFLNILSITVGIFGFLYIWDLSLSSITMIQLIMSIGFSVDYSVHVCSAYILTDAPTRKERVKSAIIHAATPILNATMSSFLGIIILLLSDSYIFLTFFKLMFTVLMLGAVHAVFFLPVVLCIMGPLPKSLDPRPKSLGPRPKTQGPRSSNPEQTQDVRPPGRLVYLKPTYLPDSNYIHTEYIYHRPGTRPQLQYQDFEDMGKVWYSRGSKRSFHDERSFYDPRSQFDYAKHPIESWEGRGSKSLVLDGGVYGIYRGRTARDNPYEFI